MKRRRSSDRTRLAGAPFLRLTAVLLAMGAVGCSSRGGQIELSPGGGSPDETTAPPPVARWLEDVPGLATAGIACEIYSNRTLERFFPNTMFYLLTATEEGYADTSTYACVCLGEPLLLPGEINLLLILENRMINRHNVQSIAEIIVRLTEPDGPTTMSVLSKSTRRDPRTGKMTQVILETTSSTSGNRKQWTFDIRFDRFYSMEEKLIGHNPRVFRDVFRRPFDGPITGHERYTVFWRPPERRAEILEIRQKWLETQHPEEGP